MDVEAFEIVEIPPDSEEALALIQALDDDLRQRYPGTPNYGLDPRDVGDPRLIFLVARIDSRCIGSGAMRELETTVGEVKRMFVFPNYRGKGIARQLLVMLETRARARGYSILRLETGPRQPEAIGLYKSAGFTNITPFGRYAGTSDSICFEKSLS